MLPCTNSGQVVGAGLVAAFVRSGLSASLPLGVRRPRGSLPALNVRRLTPGPKASAAFMTLSRALKAPSGPGTPRGDRVRGTEVDTQLSQKQPPTALSPAARSWLLL